MNDLEEQWRDDVSTQLKELAKTQSATAVALERIESRIIPRQEFDAALGTRVSNEAFNGRMTTVEARISRLEGGPGAFRAWLGAALGVGGCLLQLLGTGLAIVSGIAIPIIFFLVTHH